MKRRITAAIILAAGHGTRMESDRPKVLHALAGRPMVAALIDSLSQVASEYAPGRVVVVVGPGMEAVTEAVRPHPVAIQQERLGTGHAVLCAMDALADLGNGNGNGDGNGDGDGDGDGGDIIILYGDSPLIRPETITRMIAARRAEPAPAVVVLGFDAWEPGAYGRLVIGEDGNLDAIVEAADIADGGHDSDLCNAGAIVVDAGRLAGFLGRLASDNAKGEYYLTDIVALARADGLPCRVVEGEEDEALGINSRADLALAEAVTQDRLRARAMNAGATLVDPETVYFSHDTVLGRDVTVGPNVVFGPGVAVGDGVTIRAFSHIEGAVVAAGATIGPFARLRPGADIGSGAHIGNFVEIKMAKIAAGAKIGHLSYIGDAKVGAAANIGAGTITCNYDGEVKSLTEIGAGAFIGSNTALIAPVKIGDRATTGAGSVISRDVAPGALALTRPEQKEIAGWAERKKKRRAGGKPKKKQT